MSAREPSFSNPKKLAESPNPEGTLPRIWGRRGFWQVRLRWAVAPLMIAGTLVGRALGFGFEALPIYVIAALILVYNSVFAWIYKRYSENLTADPSLDRLVTLLEVIADYLAMFLLIHYTGGASSPLVPFLVFHVIISAIQLSARTAYLMASVAAAVLWALLLGEIMHWIPCYGLTFRGESVHFMDRPIYAAAWLLFFTASLFITAALVSRIMRRLRQGLVEQARTTLKLRDLNTKLSGLYTMVGALGTERHLQPILDRVTSEMTQVMGASAATIKLLSADGKTLRYVASKGLPADLVAETVIDLDESPLNRRVVQGETLLHEVIPGDKSLKLGEILNELGIRIAAFSPLRFEDRIIGTIGVFAIEPDHFDDGDLDFLELAAKLVAIAIEDARANEAIEALMAGRTRFMLQVAHNLRAPLSAGLSMMELLEEGYVGEVSAAQVDHLKKIEARLRSLDQTISELLTIARTRDWTHEIPDVVVDLAGLAAYTEHTFRTEALAKNLRFEVTSEADLPQVDSGADLLEQVMDNLVSNAIKYTPEGGEIEVRFARAGDDTIAITVRDTGIGIPAGEQQKLFQEFFRASNAKRFTTIGTGLGLALVKQTVERHDGSLAIESAEGEGTRVTITLPIHQARSALS